MRCSVDGEPGRPHAAAPAAPAGAARAGRRGAVRRAPAPAVHGQPAPEGAGRRGLGDEPRPGHDAPLPHGGWTRTPPARRLWLLAASRPRAGPPCSRTSCASTGAWPAGRRPPQAFFAGAAGKWDRLREELYGDALHAGGAPGPAAAGLGAWPTSAAAPARRGRALAPHVRARDRRRPVGGHAEGGAAAHGRPAPTSSCGRGASRRCPSRTRQCDGALLRARAHLRARSPPRALREMARILRPGGRAVVVDLLRHDREDFRRADGPGSASGFEPGELGQPAGRRRLRGRARAGRCRPSRSAKGPALAARHGGRADAPSSSTTRRKKENEAMTTTLTPSRPKGGLEYQVADLDAGRVGPQGDPCWPSRRCPASWPCARSTRQRSRSRASASWAACT